ncbi:MAG TPA: hypothetical protein VF701_13725 [Thermoanaerobaculia bacterium]
MIRRFLTLTLAVSLLAAPSALASIEGAWTAVQQQDKVDSIHLNIARARNQMGITMQLSRLPGLSAADVHSTVAKPVEFQLRSDAGIVTFDGTFRNGKGSGHFVFDSNPGFVRELRALGVSLDDQKGRTRTEEEALFPLAIHDVSVAFIRSMQAEGYRTTLDKYVAMRIFRVTPEFIREMRSLGFTTLSADDLVASRIHKVTPEFVREMRAAGWDLTLSELQSSSIHGATPAFAEQMRGAGYPGLRHSDLVAFRIHRVTPDFIRELAELGYRDLPASKLLSMKIHRVTPQYIRELRDLGYSNVPVDKLVSMRIHKIDPKLVRKLQDQ